jgi:hypothetical protein
MAIRQPFGVGGKKDTDLHIEYVDLMVLRANIFSLKKSSVCVCVRACENFKFLGLELSASMLGFNEEEMNQLHAPASLYTGDRFRVH